MFQWCSLKTSHPHLLPQSPKVCSVHLCLFFCFAYRVIITIFLNPIYMCEYAVMFFIFLAYFTLYNGVKNNSFESVLMRWMKLHPLALDKRLISGTEWSAEVICKEQVLDVKGETPKGPGVQIPLYVPLSLSSPANICLSNICFSISTWIAFLPFEVLNHYPQHPLLSLAEGGS